MNMKTTLILLLLVIVALGALILMLKTEPPETNDNDATARQLLPKIAEVTELSLESPRGGKVVLKLIDDKWRLAGPPLLPANREQVRATVSAITGLEYIRKYGPDDVDAPNDSLTGLAKPSRQVTVIDGAGAAHVLNIGRHPPLRPKQTYVQIAGDKTVYVVSRDLHATLDKTAGDYRNKKMIDFAPSRAQRIVVSGDQQFELIKTGANWAFEHPVRARADLDQIASLISSLSYIRAEKFVAERAESLAAYALDKPVLTVTVELGAPAWETPAMPPVSKAKPTVIRIDFGAVAEKGKTVFAKLAGQPWVFTVDDRKLKELQPKLNDLRDKQVLQMGFEEVKRVEVTQAKGSDFTLEKNLGDWRMTAPFAGPANQESVRKLLGALRGLKAQEFRDNPTSMAALGVDPESPVGKVVLHQAGVGTPLTLLLGTTTESGQLAHVRPVGAKAVAVIGSNDYRILLRPSPAYWDDKIFELPVGAEVFDLKIVRKEGTVALAKDANGRWKVVHPLAAEIDSANLDAILRSLRVLRADKITRLGTKLPKRLASARPMQITLRYRKLVLPPRLPASAPATSLPAGVKFETRTTPSLLVVKDRGNTYAWIKDARPVVVAELPASLYDTLTAELRDRTVLTIDADKAIAFKMVVDKKTMAFNKKGDEWSYADDPLVKVADDKVAGYLRALSSFKALRFVDHSQKPKLSRFGLNKPVMTITIETVAGEKISLAISRTGPVGTKGHYAVSSQATGVFVLAADASGKMTKKLKDFSKKE